MRHITVAVIGGALILVGLYFFPLGEDIVFKQFLDFAGGDYWLARAYQYVVFGAAIVLGYLLLTRGTGFLSHPVVVIGGLILLALVLNIGGGLF